MSTMETTSRRVTEGAGKISLRAYTTVGASGAPRVTDASDGDLQIYPAGMDGSDVTLFMSVEAWRELNRVVEQHIASRAAVPA